MTWHEHHCWCLACDECGASVDRTDDREHECLAERLLDFKVFALRDEIERLDADFGAFLSTPHGLFAAWDAERRR